jgi:hypothetical protein
MGGFEWDGREVYVDPAGRGIQVAGLTLLVNGERLVPFASLTYYHEEMVVRGEGFEYRLTRRDGPAFTWRMCQVRIECQECDSRALALESDD